MTYLISCLCEYGLLIFPYVSRTNGHGLFHYLYILFVSFVSKWVWPGFCFPSCISCARTLPLGDHLSTWSHRKLVNTLVVTATKTSLTRLSWIHIKRQTSPSAWRRYSKQDSTTSTIRRHRFLGVQKKIVQLVAKNPRVQTLVIIDVAHGTVCFMRVCGKT